MATVDVVWRKNGHERVRSFNTLERAMVWAWRKSDETGRRVEVLNGRVTTIEPQDKWLVL